ncbi:hypothetical protein BGW36DRAFT_395228 [Talaromyces proteolyticus]|uniref:MaoC-like domain-containing protein n=1 Tax=Talaromyces proteolyticus TaxID=1131652 RepID=A0AAD4L1X8_9EURO|nr:uncharacterized protein BGW36DRAFT_395228 [Talaromyces proteolyticus]KAH8702626.1 hypothetical protein BGW36DRAFT_395228 [Talaromyces proteolyticus]
MLKLARKTKGGEAVTPEASKNMRTISSLAERALQQDLTSRPLPLTFDYLTPQASHLLNLSLLEVLPPGSFGSLGDSKDPRRLPSIRDQHRLLPGHHLVYFPPQVTLSELLRDGTDTLHDPGEPFHRRLWAGGSVTFPISGSLKLDGQRAVCVEKIRDVNVKGQDGDEMVFVTIERRFTTVSEDEDESQLRAKVSNSPDVLIETRDLVFLREPDLASHPAAREKRIPADPDISQRLTPNKALLFRFSALTFNAHLIHLDQSYTKNIEGHDDLLVHGPLSLVLMLSVLSSHLATSGLSIRKFEYKNLAPLHVDQEMRVCAKAKNNTEAGDWGVWIEGPSGGLAVRGTAWPLNAR